MDFGRYDFWWWNSPSVTFLWSLLLSCLWQRQKMFVISYFMLWCSFFNLKYVFSPCKSHCKMKVTFLHWSTKAFTDSHCSRSRRYGYEWATVLSMVLVGDKQNPAIPSVERDVLGILSWGFGSAEGEPCHQEKADWGSVLWGTVG